MAAFLRRYWRDLGAYIFWGAITIGCLRTSIGLLVFNEQLPSRGAIGCAFLLSAIYGVRQILAALRGRVANGRV